MTPAEAPQPPAALRQPVTRMTYKRAAIAYESDVDAAVYIYVNNVGKAHAVAKRRLRAGKNTASFLTTWASLRPVGLKCLPKSKSSLTLQSLASKATCVAQPTEQLKVETSQCRTPGCGVKAAH